MEEASRTGVTLSDGGSGFLEFENEVFVQDMTFSSGSGKETVPAGGGHPKMTVSTGWLTEGLQTHLTPGDLQKLRAERSVRAARIDLFIYRNGNYSH
jgi:hypothetical protein